MIRVFYIAVALLLVTPCLAAAPVATNMGTNSNAIGATIAIASVSCTGLIVVVVNETDTSGTTGGSISDTVNSYTALTAIGNDNTPSSYGFGVVFYALNATLSSGTITYTKNTSGDATVISAFCVTGILASSALDSLVTTSGYGLSSANPLFTITSGSAAYPREMFLALVTSYNVTTNTATWFGQDTGNGWTAPPNANRTGRTIVNGGSQVNAGIAALNYAPTNASVYSVAYAYWTLGFIASDRQPFIATPAVIP